MRRLAASLILFLAALPCCAQTRILCGSKNSYTDKQGNLWSTDAAQFTSSTNSGSYANYAWIPISGTPDPPIYQSQRWGRGMAYTFPLANGTYKVNLYFAETWSGAFASGVRVFNVALNDTVAISNLDVFAKVGAKAADVETGTVIVSNGSLVISFQPVRENPIINAIEILPVAPAVPPQPDSITVKAQLLWCALCDGSDNLPATGNLVVSQTGGPSSTQNISADGTVTVGGTVDVSQDPLEFTVQLTDANGLTQAGAAMTWKFPRFELASATFLVKTVSLGIVRIAHTVDANGDPAVRLVDVSGFSIAK